MQVREIIEQLVANEVKGLCATCAHVNHCKYHQTINKQVIQCELFEIDLGENCNETAATGLCKSCDNATTCKLQGRKSGVWHCNEFNSAFEES